MRQLRLEPLRVWDAGDTGGGFVPYEASLWLPFAAHFLSPRPGEAVELEVLGRVEPAFPKKVI